MEVGEGENEYGICPDIIGSRTVIQVYLQLRV